MSKVLALDWDQHQLRLILARRMASRIQIDRVAEVSISSDARDGAERAASVHDRMAEVLADPRFRGAEVLVSVRRSDVELRLLRIPNVPAEELPDIVRMQAMSEFSEVAEDWPIDYLPLTQTDDENSVLAAVISPRRIDEYQKALELAELRPSQLILRPTATALLITELLDAPRPDVEMCLEDLGGELELSVLRYGKPVLTRTVQAPRTDSYDRFAFLAQEVKRTALSARNQLGGHDVDRVIMFGAVEEQAGQIGDQLESRLGLPVVVCDPFDEVHISRDAGEHALAHPGRFGAAIGLLLSDTVEDAPLIDFLHPRRHVPSQSRRNVALATAVAAGLVLLVGGGAFYWRLTTLDRAARELQMKIQNQRPLIAAAEQRGFFREVDLVDAWHRGDVDWLAQMKQISSELPGPEKARFLRWQANVLNSGNGQIIVEGVVDQQQTIGEIDRALRGDQRRVRTFGGEFENRVPGYPWRFKQTITVETGATDSPAAQPKPRSTVLPR